MTASYKLTRSAVEHIPFDDEEVAPPSREKEPEARQHLASSKMSLVWSSRHGHNYWATEATVDRLEAGLYCARFAPDIGYFLEERTNLTDTIIPLPDTKSEYVLDEIKQFSELKPEFVKHGFLYKRGILLWGPPGSGKTCTMQLLIKLVIERLDGVALLVDNPTEAMHALTMFRRVEPNRQVIAILEDIDELIKRWDGEASFLSLLDGETQVNNVIYVATTNYPENLDKRFVDRPSRFDTIIYIGMPSADARRAYLKAKAPELKGKELTEYVEASDGFSIAHLRELIIATKCFGKPLNEAADRLKQMTNAKPSSDRAPDRESFGFSTE